MLGHPFFLSLFNLPIWVIAPLVILFLITIVFIVLILDSIRLNNFNTRSYQFLDEYPMQKIIRSVFNDHRMYEMFLEDFQKMKEKINKDTFCVKIPFLPCIVFTIDVQNITHILKTNFENYGLLTPYNILYILLLQYYR